MFPYKTQDHQTDKYHKLSGGTHGKMSKLLFLIVSAHFTYWMHFHISVSGMYLNLIDLAKVSLNRLLVSESESCHITNCKFAIFHCEFAGFFWVDWLTFGALLKLWCKKYSKYEIRREVMFSVCSHSFGGGGYPSPSHNTFTGPMSFPGVPQWLVPGQDGRGVPHNGVPPWLGQDRGSPWWGYPWPGMGYPTQVRMGVPHDVGTPSQGWVPPPSQGWGTPLGRDGVTPPG